MRMFHLLAKDHQFVNHVVLKKMQLMFW